MRLFKNSITIVIYVCVVLHKNIMFPGISFVQKILWLCNVVNMMLQTHSIVIKSQLLVSYSSRFNPFGQGLIQDYYEGGGYCCRDRCDKCAKRTSLGVWGHASQKGLQHALQLNLGPCDSKNHIHSSLISEYKHLPTCKTELEYKHDSKQSTS